MFCTMANNRFKEKKKNNLVLKERLKYVSAQTGGGVGALHIIWLSWYFMSEMIDNQIGVRWVGGYLSVSDPHDMSREKTMSRSHVG